MKPLISPSKYLTPLLAPTIFQTILELSQKYKSVNLASGFPDWETPEFLLQHTMEATYSQENQYTLPGGHPFLLQQLATRYSKKYRRNMNPQNICVGIGASGITYDILTTYLNPGEEVIVFEPFFEIHPKEAMLLGAKIRVCSLIEPVNFKKDTWKINFAQLEALFNENTRMIILNSPNNPTGKVFTQEEYEQIGKIIEKYPKVLVLSDEVYETFIFDNRKFISFSMIENMFERTLCAYSLGKMFSCTGWRVGFCTGPENLIVPVRQTHSMVAYSVPRPSQVGFAKSFADAEKQYLESQFPYFKHISNRLEANRNLLIERLEKLDLDLEMTCPEGGYFIIGNMKKAMSKIPKKYFFTDSDNVVDGSKPLTCEFEEMENPQVTPDIAFSKYMTIERGVSVIPLSSFFHQETPVDPRKAKGRYLFRVVLCRKQETIQAALDRLKV